MAGKPSNPWFTPGSPQHAEATRLSLVARQRSTELKMQVLKGEVHPSISVFDDRLARTTALKFVALNLTNRNGRMRNRTRVWRVDRSQRKVSILLDCDLLGHERLSSLSEKRKRRLADAIAASACCAFTIRKEQDRKDGVRR